RPRRALAERIEISHDRVIATAVDQVGGMAVETEGPYLAHQGPIAAGPPPDPAAFANPLAFTGQQAAHRLGLARRIEILGPANLDTRPDVDRGLRHQRQRLLDRRTLAADGPEKRLGGGRGHASTVDFSHTPLLTSR